MKTFKAFILLCLFATLAACGSGKGDIVAKVNGLPIYKQAFTKALDYEITKYPPKFAEDSVKFASLKRGLLEKMIKAKVIYSAAKGAGITISDNELAEENKQFKSRYTEATFQKMLEIKGIKYDEWKNERIEELAADKLIQRDVISKIDISDADILKYYKSHKNEFSHGDEVHARQILVEDPKLAADLYKRALAGENFAALAQEFSVAPEGKRGGDLGWFARGIMPKAFDEACFPLPADKISPIVKTEYGYHIFKVIEHREAKSAKLDEVKDKIIARLQQERSEDAFGKWYDPIRKKASVQIFDKVFNGETNK